MKKGQRRSLVALAVAATLFGGAQLLRPVGEQYVGPMVHEQLNTAINGTATYNNFEIGWDGTVRIKDLSIHDGAGAVVADVPETEVSLDVVEAIKMPFSNASALHLIRSVTLKDPTVYAVEQTDKSWNITSLVKEQDSESEMDFRGYVSVDNGTAYISWLNGRKTKVDTIDATVKLGEYPKLDGALTANVDGQAVKVRGSYSNDDDADFNMFIGADRLSLQYGNDFIPKDVKAHIVAGDLEQVALTIKRSDGKYSFEGGFDITGLDADYSNASVSDNPFTIRHGGAHVTLQDTNISITNAKAAVNDQQFFGFGNVNIANTDNPDLNLTLSGTELELEKLIPIGVSGIVGGTVHVTGPADALAATGELEARKVMYDGIVVEEGSTHFTYENNIVNLNDITLQLNGGHAVGRASYNLDSEEYEATLEGQDIPLGLIGQALNQPIYGTINGQAYVKGRGTESDPTVTAVFEGTQVGYDSITLDTVAGQINGAEGTYVIKYLNGTVGDGKFTAYGVATDDTIALNVSGKDIPLGMIGSYVGQPMDGSATVDGSIEGAFDNPKAHLMVTSEGGHVAGLRFDNTYLDVDLENQVATINKGFVQDGHGYYDVKGNAQLRGDKALDLDVIAETVRIENVASMATDFPITGWLSLRSKVNGTMDNPVVRGYVHAWDGSVQGKLFSDVHFGFRYANNFFGVRDLVAKAYGATFYGQGKMVNNELDFTFFGDTIYLEPWLKEYNDVSGYMTIEGTLKGSIDKSIVEGTIGSNSVVVNGMPLKNIRGNIYADPSVVNLRKVSFDDSDTGHFMVDGGMTLDGQQRLFGYAIIENGNLNNFLKLAKTPVENMQGAINGRLDLGGTLKNPDMGLKGTIDNISVGDTPWGTAKVDVSLADKKLTIKQGELPIGDGMIAAAGTADLNGDSDIQIAANNVALGYLTPLAKEPIAVTGDLHFIANVTGKTLNPHVEVSAEVVNANYNGVGLDRVYAMASMDDKVIHVQQLVGQRGQYKGRISGDMPLAAIYTSGYLPPGDKSAMDLTLDVNEADLAVLPLMTPMITEGVGALQGSVHITGTYDQPQANGMISVKDGTIHFKGVKKDLTGVFTQLIFKGQQLEIIGGATMGKGNVGLSGQVNWTGTTLNNYSAVAQFNALDIESDYFSGPLNGEIGVLNKDGLPTVAGHVDLDNNTIAIPLSLTSSEGGSPIGLDVNLNIGKKVRLYSAGLYDIILDGGAHIGGTTVRPDIDGGFEVKEGTVKYLNNTFKIINGKADFVPGSFMPILHVEAESRVQSYNVNLAVNGPVDQMDLRLTSEPRLDERQIISLLTFGYSNGNDSSLSSDDANALLAAGVRSALAGYIEGTLKNSLGLDRINITSGSLDPNEDASDTTNGYYNIEIGKYLLPNLMVTYSQGLNNDVQAYGVQYDINNHFSVNGWMNSNDHSYFGAQWRSEF